MTRLIDLTRRATPSALTLASFSCGVAVILTAAQAELGAALVAAAILLDWADGWAARALSATSAFGRELDSLSDVVCFGVAPAVLVHRCALAELGLAGSAAALIFAAAAAVRLARFNVRAAGPAVDIRLSVGLTVPMAACVNVASLLLFSSSPVWLAVLQGVLAALMVSTFSYRTLKGFRPTPGAVAALAVAALGLLLAGVMLGVPAAMALGAFGYALSGPAEEAITRLTR